MLRDVLVQTIGQYTPVLIDGLPALDVPWLLSAVLLCVLVYSVFRLVGGLFR